VPYLYLSSWHGTNNYSLLGALVHGFFRFYKIADISGFSLYITGKIKTGYRVHREETTCTVLVNCLVDLRNDRRANQIDKLLGKKICRTLINL